MTLEEIEKAAEKLYSNYTANHPTIHCNRFPNWNELSETSKAEWREKARGETQ